VTDREQQSRTLSGVAWKCLKAVDAGVSSGLAVGFFQAQLLVHDTHTLCVEVADCFVAAIINALIDEGI